MRKIYFALAMVAVLTLGTSCKPRQSAYRQVYESAREREMQQSASQPTTVVKDAAPLPPVEVSVRKERVDAVSPADAAGLRRFNVVIASLSVRLNAENLKTRMENEGHRVILAQNEQGMFRVIVGSFDDRAAAEAQRQELNRRYSAMGTPDFLRRTYGVPFNDMWILERQF
ncbi:MAG: SPOR domain-containing protein [Dysgonamonadaceae bacterium]|jgi:cell division septation protein DedD|nr:SPOR domain-containing protein [Dysgonamonadaceae bacterium]